MKTFTFSYQQKVYSELSSLEVSIFESCKKAVSKSYAPYSNFNVSCALYLTDGSIITAANQENASFPQCLCAEMVALSTFSSNKPHEKILKLLVYASSNNKVINSLLAPCGQCRQTIFEFEERQKAPIEIYLCNGENDFVVLPNSQALLPFAFSKNVF